MNNMKIEEIITSINNKKIIETNKLKQKKERYEKKEYLVEGIKIVYEYIKSKLSNTGNNNSFKIFLLKENVFNKITNDVNPEGIILRVKMPNNDNILSQNVTKKDVVNDINSSFRIVFENISDPRKSRNYNKNSSSSRT